ncbi:ATP-grasp domain-containing protein [Neptuniibacter sp. QD48_55]|uniref:ATP-grasp domain-containing protein n=1 Tax=Neptuniibacter sp. QD48_55 TaxID=3398212 RepID=UPI0039F544D1
MKINKTLFIIGAGPESLPGIKQAKEMGLKLIIADGNPNAVGLELADYPVVVSTYDEDELCEAAREYTLTIGKLDGVIAMCTDVPRSAAKIASEFGLTSLSEHTAFLVADKLAMKEHFLSHGIAIPSFMPIRDEADLENAADKFGYPFIVKPVDSRGARGVLLIHSKNEHTQAWKEAVSESPTNRVMAEAFIKGPQISTEALVVDGEITTLGFSDRNYEWLDKYAPNIIENGGELPSHLSPEEHSFVLKLFEEAVKALGIQNGVAKGDMVLSSEGAKVIEVAGRLSGGYFSSTQIPISTGVNFIEQAIRISLGEKPTKEELTPHRARAIAVRYLNPAPGKITKISGIERARRLEGVEMLQIDVNVGDNIAPMTNHTKRAGFVITSADQRKNAVSLAQEVINLVTIYTETE